MPDEFDIANILSIGVVLKHNSEFGCNAFDVTHITDLRYIKNSIVACMAGLLKLWEQALHRC
jgi:hypothetical protein